MGYPEGFGEGFGEGKVGLLSGPRGFRSYPVETSSKGEGEDTIHFTSLTSPTLKKMAFETISLIFYVQFLCMLVAQGCGVDAVVA